MNIYYLIEKNVTKKLLWHEITNSVLWGEFNKLIIKLLIYLFMELDWYKPKNKIILMYANINLFIYLTEFTAKYLYNKI